VITGAFGMNLDGVAFAIVLAMLVLSAPVGYFIFRRLGWI
jgi:Mg2+ and Co2+ transporter CorA